MTAREVPRNTPQNTPSDRADERDRCCLAPPGAPYRPCGCGSHAFGETLDDGPEANDSGNLNRRTGPGGVTGDDDAVPNLQVLCDGIESATEELVALVR